MAKQKYNWQKIKQEFITANLASETKGLELKELALKYGISLNVLWNQSSKDGWADELAELQKEKNDELSKQVVTAAVEIDKGLLMEEYRVRVENYNVSTKMMEKLINRWNSLTDEDLLKMSPLDVVKGVHVCLKAREQAAGLPRVFVLDDKLDNNGPPEEMPAAEGAPSQTKVAKLANSLSLYLEKNNDEDAIDV